MYKKKHQNCTSNLEIALCYIYRIWNEFIYEILHLTPGTSLCFKRKGVRSANHLLPIFRAITCNEDPSRV